ncbi:MAG: NfeD family protein [Planctomycetota bacterium]|jgi:membrane-bound serine protease (ClpP class)
MDTYPILVVLLVTVGLATLIGELMLPSAGILTVVSLTCLVGSAICAWQAWYSQGHLIAWWTYVGSVLFLIPSAVVGTLYVLPRTSYGRELFASPQSGEELTPFQDEEQELQALVNEHGKTQNLFSPGGMVEIGRDRFHAESEGVMIEAGTDVVVVGVRGNRLVVRPLSLHGQSTAASAETAAFDPAAADAAGGSNDERSIDFDVPETA